MNWTIQSWLNSTQFNWIELINERIQVGSQSNMDTVPQFRHESRRNWTRNRPKRQKVAQKKTKKLEKKN